jgi:hypothetical protein
VDMTTLRWRKSSFSGGEGGGNDSCVEVAFAGSAAAVRDSKNAGGPVLVLTASAWFELVASAK